ncbi:MAG: TIGR03936 family radical SAM-associated protein [Clostridia bacterium]|nr:TIGR03936 family radical SAM-associated protein [Clostridia bacterium]
MNDYYLTYKRGDSIKYVSHLDFVRVFGRAFRRAELPIAYSEGFNPHPLLTFALPLSVGYTSECELMEFVMEKELETEEIKEKLQKAMPIGIEITEVCKGKTRMKKLDNALYIVKAESIPDDLSEFLSLDSILIEKKTKSGIKETDIRADIKNIALKDGCMEMLLSAGSRANLKPEVVINAMNKYIDGYNSGECEYHRKQILDGEFNPL